jgi:hypothetical protein
MEAVNMLKAASLILLASATVLLPAAAEARRERDTGSSVTSCSRYGKGCISAPTRRGNVEREVRLPGGTWIGCKMDCRETLREESIDFFETLRERAPDQRR